MKLKAAQYVTCFLRCDNAGENLDDLSHVCDKYGIIIEYTAPNTPQQNGVVERKFATIRDRSCAAMYAAKFNNQYQGLFWAECAMTRIINIVSNSKSAKCPDWLWYGLQPTLYEHLVEFGWVGYVTLSKKQHKLDPKAIECVMIGYSLNHMGDTYRMFNPSTRKIIQTRDIRWADWHRKIESTDGLNLFNSEAYGIDELLDNMTEFFDNSNDEQAVVVPATGNGTPVTRTNPTVLPPLLPVDRHP